MILSVILHRYSLGGTGGKWMGIVQSLRTADGALRKSSKWKKLITFFRSLSEGFLRHQDEEGMFHQVLDMRSSYQESSCTAMAACAFSRGVRGGWYENPEPYREGCVKACDGLKKKAIDSDGHVRGGVCRGSEFSCSRHYYAEQLLPRLDDTHGIGIIFLRSAKERNSPNPSIRW